MGYIKLLKNYKKINGGNNEIYVRIIKLIKNNQKQITPPIENYSTYRDLVKVPMSDSSGPCWNLLSQ